MDTEKLGFILSLSLVFVFTILYKEPRENPNGKDKKDRHNRTINNAKEFKNDD